MKLTIVLFAAAALAQDVLTVLNQQSSLTQFTSLLSGFPDLVDYLNQGGHTLLAPSNTALAQYQYYPRALCEYHVLKGNFALTSFPDATSAPLLVPTLLTNTSYTNVTGGQRVELVATSTSFSVLSAIRQPSMVSTGNIFFQGGLVHILDTTLRIPPSFPQTMTEANLHNLAALLTKGDWLVPNSIAYKIALETPDITILGPDGDGYGADYTGWDGLNQTQLDRIFTYHILPGVTYTPDLGNATHDSLANISVTSREYVNGNKSAIFINQAHIRISNYLTANGVLHVLDQPLDPIHSNETPLASDIDAAIGVPPSEKSKKITTAAIVGIVIGAIAILVMVGVLLGLKRKMRKRREQPPDYHSAMRDAPVHEQSQERRARRRRDQEEDLSGRTNSVGLSAIRLSAPLPARPMSAATSVRRALWPSRPPASTLIELDAKEYATSATELADTRWETPRTPPELDGRQRSRRGSLSPRSGMSITFHGEIPKHVGVQAQY